MIARIAALTVSCLAGGAALAQADFPAVFVANNGNLEGSVTTMRMLEGGGLEFVARTVTGTRSSTSQPCPGCNTFAIDLSPDGAHVATAHAAGNGGENLTIYEVAADGTLTVVEEFFLAQGGLDVKWIADDLVVVPLTDLSVPNQLRLYRLDDDNELVFIESAPVGTFCTSLALHPSGRWLYANDSFDNTVRVFDISDGMLTPVIAVPIPVFGVAIEVDPAGRFLYAAGGISAGGQAFAGYAIDQGDGTLSPLPGSPFTSPGASPKGFAFSGDGAYLYVSHGSDATIRAFALDAAGVPTSTGFSFDIGLQGTLREMGSLGNTLFAVDETTALDGIQGVYDFRINPTNGDLGPLPLLPTDPRGISPNDIAVWGGQGGCSAADIAEPYGVLDLADIQGFIQGFVGAEPLADLALPIGVFDLADIQAFVVSFTAGCP